MINLKWFKRNESKTDKRVLLETEGREEDLQLLILQNTGGWTLEGEASEQLEALFRREQEDKLSYAMADVLELCRERWKDFERTTRRDVFEKCDGFKTKDGNKDRKELRTLRSLRAKGCWKAKPRPLTTARRSLLSPPNNRTVRTVRAVRDVCGVRSLRSLRTPTTAATRNSSIHFLETPCLISKLRLLHGSIDPPPRHRPRGWIGRTL